MDKVLVYNENNTIVINANKSTLSEFEGKIKLLNNAVTIEQVVVDKKITNLPHSENLLLLKVEFAEKIDQLKFKLQCSSDEYFFAIQDYYSQLLENEYDDELLFHISPRIELLEHIRKDNKCNTAMLTQRNIKYLLSQSKRDKERIDVYHKTNEKTKIGNIFSPPIDPCSIHKFYIVLSKFRRDAYDEGKSRLSFFNGNDFHWKKQECPYSKQPIAVIVHGLVSQIGNQYVELANYLVKKGYRVYGFDYLTISQRIEDSGYALKCEIEELKQRFSESKILVVAHSMGGLASRSAIIEHNAPIDKLIMAGTPNNGAIYANNSEAARHSLLMCLKKLTIKRTDFVNLVQLKRHELEGLRDLSEKGNYVKQLNKKDVVHNDKKYFGLVGNFLGLRNDGIVRTRNMITINEIKIPHVSYNRNHFNYFKKDQFHQQIEKALQYLK